MGNNVLLKTEFKELKLFRRGKVRDVYDLGDKLLIVSTDRISCFDVILPSGIPLKGKVLTSISAFWFDFIKDVIAHHMITADVEKYPPELNWIVIWIKMNINENNLKVYNYLELPRFKLDFDVTGKNLLNNKDISFSINL